MFLRSVGCACPVWPGVWRVEAQGTGSWWGGRGSAQGVLRGFARADCLGTSCFWSLKCKCAISLLTTTWLCEMLFQVIT